MNRPSSAPPRRGILFLLLTGLALALPACAPQPAQQQQPTQVTADAKPEEAAACLDIRAALVKCKDGETMTHEGCPEPAYMQRCGGKLPAQ